LDKNERIKENLKGKKKQLLDGLILKGILKDKKLIKAFMDVPLEKFIPGKLMNYVKLYEDNPNLFYYNEQNPNSYRTISAPHMITIMLQGLNLKENDDLLILGAKSGYIAALAHKLAPKGEIIILEANSEIAKFTLENLKKLKLDQNISIVVKNPLRGMPELCPWQKILVTGSIELSKIYPLLRQLDQDGGVLFAPIGGSKVQTYTQILRQEEEFFGKKQLPVNFSPLITQIELDELELITDLEEFRANNCDNLTPEESQSVWNEQKVSIKYTTNIIDSVIPESPIKTKTINIDDRDLVIELLEKITEIMNRLKLEDNVSKYFEHIDTLDNILRTLKIFKRSFDLKIKKLQNRLNQIRSYNIVRKELESKDISDSSVLNQKVKIINQQILEINLILEFVQGEIKRIKTVYLT
jgi:protein-L-isoaspartate(D-aspartate) O-methyltransferase